VTKWRILSSNKCDPERNMAIDEALLLSYRSGKCPPTFRLYGWEPEGISLGYRQKRDNVLHIEECKKQGIKCVRRITGGESIFHSNDISYSIVCSSKDLNLPSSVKESYKVLCRFLIEAYKTLGLSADFFSSTHEGAKEIETSFCFASQRDFDLNIDGKKIGGNAQKRHRNIILLHGSVPLKLDIQRAQVFFKENLADTKKRILSLEEAVKKYIDFKEFGFLLRKSFSKVFKEVNLIESNLIPSEYELVESLLKEKYQNADWNTNA